MYINVHRSRLHRVACIYPTFPCVDVISWIVSHIDVKTMTLSSTNGRRLATLLAADYRHMYHLPKPEVHTDSLLYATKNYVVTRDVVKSWVKEPSKFPKDSYQHI